MVAIRDAREADRAGIYEVHVASVRAVEPAAYSQRELDAWEGGIAPGMYTVDDPTAEFLVAETGSDVVGLGKASLTESEIEMLYVAPESQNDGIATRLIDALEESLRTHGAGSAYVEASLNAVPFYRYVGYEQLDTHVKPITVDGTTVETAMADMEKTL